MLSFAGCARCNETGPPRVRLGVTVMEVRPLSDDRTEPGTFDDYVRTRSVALQRFAFLVVRNHEDARDAVQDALIGLYPRWDAVAAQGSVDAYVHRSIINASVSRWRKVKNSTPVADVGDWRASEGDVAQEVVDAEVAWQLCDSLPPQQRAAVVLRFYGDRSFAEIGEILECPEATARSHVHRALTKLRTQLVNGGSA